MSTWDCDAVVIGSGPGGSTAAEVLCAAGWSVVVLEKGRNHLIDTEPPHDPLRHFANDELAAHRRHLLGPDPLLEPRSYRRSAEDGDRLVVGEVNNLPSTVGGGGVHADAKLPRFREEDFRLRSERGPVDDASVEDWPLSYDDLEPHYAAVEELFGVAGEAGANPFAAPRSSPYPLPPGDDMPMAVVTAAAAARAGLHPYRAPTGVNSVPNDGRPACTDCGFCGGYGCPVQAKSDPVSALQRALRSGRCDLRPECYATELVLDATGRRATGVRYLDLREHPEPATREVRARHAVILAGGAFETPRFLLRQGLGGDLVGRFLTYHYQTFTVGMFPRDRFPDGTGGERGRSVTHLHDGTAPGGGRGGPAVGARRGGGARRRTDAGGGGRHLRCGAAPPRLDARQRAPSPDVGVHHAGRGPPAGLQPGRPRPVGARRVGAPRRPGDLRPAPPRAGGLGVRGAPPRGGAHRCRGRGGLQRHLAAAG